MRFKFFQFSAKKANISYIGLCYSHQLYESY